MLGPHIITLGLEMSAASATRRSQSALNAPAEQEFSLLVESSVGSVFFQETALPGRLVVSALLFAVPSGYSHAGQAGSSGQCWFTLVPNE